MTMPNNPVYFVDSSILVELLKVPGKCDPARLKRVQEDMKRHEQERAQYVLPVTTIIEVGNHISQAPGDTYACAKRFSDIVKKTADGEAPWQLRPVTWDAEYLCSLLRGDSTGVDLTTHLSMTKNDRQAPLGAGDVSILVERDRFAERTAYDDVRVWTIDSGLAAYANLPSRRRA